MSRFQEINVLYSGNSSEEQVGILAISGQKVLFEYDQAWIKKGLQLSPHHLPTTQSKFQFEMSRLYNGLPGLFADSLPDGWGMLIMDRFFLNSGIRRDDISPLDRLAYLGTNAMGALIYQPMLQKDDQSDEAVQIGVIAQEALKFYEGDIEETSRLLSKIGGSPGGARPKGLIGISDCGTRCISGLNTLPVGYSHWLIKFSGLKPTQHRTLGPYEGVIEYIYLKMAEAAGITVPEYRLITDESGIQHIAVRRFDRPNRTDRIHSATAAGLLHADPGTPSLDYSDLIKWAWVLTKDSRSVEEQFRRAVFNYYAVNCDDHAKNHGYLMDSTGRWYLSPAYDLIYSTGPGGEHWTSYLGEGKNVPCKTFLKIAQSGLINERTANEIIDQVWTALEQFSVLCKDFNVPSKYSSPILEEMIRVKRI